MIRASVAERAAYAEAGGVYPLAGWIRVSGVRCPVEDLRGAGYVPGEPAWELRAPAGTTFGPEGRGVLAQTLRELERIAAQLDLTTTGVEP